MANSGVARVISGEVARVFGLNGFLVGVNLSFRIARLVRGESGFYVRVYWSVMESTDYWSVLSSGL